MPSYFLLFFSAGTSYIFLFFFVCLSAIAGVSREQKKYNFFYLINILLVLTFFTGLRWTTGTDWYSYKKLFDEIKFDWLFLSSINHFDFGYILLNVFVRLFTDNYTLFLLTDSLIAILLIVICVKKTSHYPTLSLFIFLTNYYFGHYLGSNRRIIALGFVLLAFYAFYKKKYFLWGVLHFCAFFFHRSSLVCLILIFFVSKKMLTKKIFWIIILTSALFGLFESGFFLLKFLAVILDKFSGIPLFTALVHYVNNPAQDRGMFFFLLAVVKRLAFVSIYFYFLNKKKTDNFTIYCFNIYFFACIFYIILNGTNVFLTLTTYFTLIEIVLAGRIFKYLQKNEKYFFLTIVFANGLLQIFTSFTMFPDLFFPYISVFNGIERGVY